MSSKFWAELSSDYEKLFEIEIEYNVIIYTGDELNIKIIQIFLSRIIYGLSRIIHTKWFIYGLYLR